MRAACPDGVQVSDSSVAVTHHKTVHCVAAFACEVISFIQLGLVLKDEERTIHEASAAWKSRFVCNAAHNTATLTGVWPRDNLRLQRDKSH